MTPWPRKGINNTAKEGHQRHGQGRTSITRPRKGVKPWPRKGVKPGQGRASMTRPRKGINDTAKEGHQAMAKEGRQALAYLKPRP
ncbi:hypothetical protein ACOMHN_017168 [Nucella lapillus]